MLREWHWRTVASATLQLAVLCALAVAFFMRTPQVSGLSMAPHIDSGEVIIINTLAYRFRTPGRGDIIAFRHDGLTPEIFIKRVVGLPGDRVRIDGGRVLVNGAVLVEPYVRYRDGRSFREVTVRPGELYVLGDNRADSDDSRFWGFVDDKQVLGRALFGIWPLRHLGAI